MNRRERLPRHIGPYEAWLFDTGRPYAFRSIRGWGLDQPLGGLLELETPRAVISLPAPSGGRPPFRIPPLWQADGSFETRFVPSVLYPRGMGMAQNNSDALDNALKRLTVEHFAARTQDSPLRFRINVPLQNRMLHPNGAPAAASVTQRPDPPQNLTIIAVIDDGIPFAHQNFCDDDGNTRIEYCWLQTATSPGANSPMLFGREYTGAQIDGLIAQYAGDEDALYANSGAVDADPELGFAINRHATHGAHILDVAAGRGPHHPQPMETPHHHVSGDNIKIIAVQLPNTVAWDTSGFGKDMFMLMAFHYIFDRADKIAEAYGLTGDGYAALPLVVNFSYGFAAGPHDGSKPGGGGLMLEDAIDELVKARRHFAPTAVVMPSGNNFSDRLHAVIPLEAFTNLDDEPVSLPWRIQPADRTPNYLELWFPDGTVDKQYRVVVTSPTGAHEALDVDPVDDKAPEPGVTATGVSKNIVVFGDVGQLSVDRFRNGRLRVLVCVAPTEPEPSLAEGSVSELVWPAAAPAGLWKVEIVRKGGDAPEAPILAWIQRDEDPEFLLTGGRQSYFDDDGRYRRYSETGGLSSQDDDGDGASFVRRFGAMNGLATGETILVVGGYGATALASYATDRGLPASFSGSGPSASVATGQADKHVMASALASAGPSTPGIVAAGTRSGALSLVVGTSTAAPQVARQLACAFAAGRTPADPHDNSQYVALLTGLDVATQAVVGTGEPVVRLGKTFVNTVV